MDAVLSGLTTVRAQVSDTTPKSGDQQKNLESLVNMQVQLVPELFRRGATCSTPKRAWIGRVRRRRVTETCTLAESSISSPRGPVTKSGASGRQERGQNPSEAPIQHCPRSRERSMYRPRSPRGHSMDMRSPRSCSRQRSPSQHRPTPPAASTERRHEPQNEGNEYSRSQEPEKTLEPPRRTVSFNPRSRDEVDFVPDQSRDAKYCSQSRKARDTTSGEESI